MFGTFKVSQLVAIICIIIGIIIYVLNYKKIKPFDEVHDIPESMTKKEEIKEETNTEGFA